MNIILAILTVLCCPVGVSAGPFLGVSNFQDDRFWPYESVVWSSVIWKDGRPEYSVGETIRVPTYKHIDLFRCEEVLLELEVVDKQRVELKAIVEEMELRSHQLQAIWSGNKPDEGQWNQHQKDMESWKAQISEILLEHQIEQLETIHNRIVFRRFGLDYFLRRHGKKVGLEVTPNETRKIAKSILEFKKTANLQDVLDSTMERLLSDLSKKQKADMLVTAEQFNLVPNDIDLLLCQTKYAVGLKETIGTETESRFQNLIATSPVVNIGFDGQLRARKPGTDYKIFCRFLGRAIDDNENLLNATPEQIDAFQNSREAYWDTVRSWQAKRTQQRAKQGFVTEPQNDEFVKALMSAAGAWDDRCRGLLNANQIAFVRNSIASEKLPKLGLIANLLVGEVGRKLAITDEQRDGIRSKWKDEIAKIESKLADIDEQIIKRISQNLEPENRKIFEAALGEKLTYVVPNFRMLTKITENLKCP